MTAHESVLHTIPPVYDKQSRVLILGSFPSVRSREVGFFTDIRKTDFGEPLRIFLTRQFRKA